MKKGFTKVKATSDKDMLPEYDFSAGVRGKHFQAMQKGYTVTVHHQDGTKTVRRFAPTSASIVLERDVQKHHPDSESVNRQLRACIAQKQKPERVKAGVRQPTSKATAARTK